MKRNSLVMISLVTAVGLAGCELIVDFDRTKIPVADAGTPIAPIADGSLVDVPDGATDQDATSPADDAGNDAGVDGSVENDAGEDAAADGGLDGLDAGSDAG